MLTIRGLQKAFGRTKALAGIDLDAKSGEVMAVIGENGAGKSTLMQILAGAIFADSGAIHLAGHPHRPRHPAEARHAGVALVPQESELVDDLTVAENITLGSEPTRHGFVLRARVHELASRALAEVTTDQCSIDLQTHARALGPSERQRVAIARSILRQAPKLLIFDEPTSSLTSRDVERLFALIQRLKQRNLAILYVSHFLEEVLAVADRYTVIRDGRTIATGEIRDTSARQLVSMMAGEPVAQHRPRLARRPGQVLLAVQQLTGRGLPVEASFELRAGEVLGIAGLVGAGRTELLHAIFGLRPVRNGQVLVHGCIGPLSPGQSLGRGLGLLSEDRRREGLAQNLSIAENITLSRLPARGPFVTKTEQQRAALPFIEGLQIRCQGAEQVVTELSGGNQQKVALARLLHHDADILLLDEPTRGIDVRSRRDVHACIDELVRQGKAVLLVSSYLPELLAMSDRIAVMCRGRLGPARPVNECTEHTLLLEATGTG